MLSKDFNKTLRLFDAFMTALTRLKDLNPGVLQVELNLLNTAIQCAMAGDDQAEGYFRFVTTSLQLYLADSLNQAMRWTPERVTEHFKLTMKAAALFDDLLKLNGFTPAESSQARVAKTLITRMEYLAQSRHRNTGAVYYDPAKKLVTVPLQISALKKSAAALFSYTDTADIPADFSDRMEDVAANVTIQAWEATIIDTFTTEELLEKVEVLKDISEQAKELRNTPVPAARTKRRPPKASP